MAILFIFVFFSRVGLIGGLLRRILVGVSQTHFFGRWVCLELNMLTFLALIRLLEGRTPRARIKYFIIQRIGSSIFLWAVGLERAGLGGTREVVAGRALRLKLGIAPFQRWFINVLSSLRWELVFLASTLQKVLPVFLLRSLKFRVLTLFLGLSGAVSVFGSINQTFLKKILAYSSIFITIWLIACEGEVAKGLEYLVAYRDALGVAIVVFATQVAEEIREVLSGIRGLFRAAVIGGFFRIGGCPPFIGFYAKITVIARIVGHAQLIWRGALVMLSVFLLYVYMRLFYFSLRFSGDSGATTGPTRRVAGAVLLLRRLLLWPGLLCLGVAHRKFWTFRI